MNRAPKRKQGNSVPGLFREAKLPKGEATSAEKASEKDIYPVASESDGKPIQQDDNYREFMTWITQGGLRYAYAKQQDLFNPESYKRKKVNKNQERHIIVVGAGIAGLSAAYELSQIGHKVTILEMQSRVGGRIKTFREGFQDGLHCEGGAMRLPPNHYLTKHYIEQFKIETRKFQNYQPKAYMHLYGESIRMEEFQTRNEFYSNKYWKGWDANLTPKLKAGLQINGLLSYYKKTIEPVKRELGENPTEQDWQNWVDKWSKLSLADFLRSTTYQSEDEPKLRPWPEIAIEGYRVSSYTPFLSESIVFILREDLGGWWIDDLYTPTNGMDMLPRAFTKQNVYGWNKNVDLSKRIVFGINVEKIDLDNEHKVTVTGTNTSNGLREEYKGDAVIITVPLHVMRRMDIPLQHNKQIALANVHYSGSTKIMLQCRTRFWQKHVGQGGFSKTNMMIGQLHYPDFDGSGIADDERGVLMVYTWETDALSLGSMTHEQAVKNAVHQISKIHPEIEKEYEVGSVQAWYADPYSLGAFVTLDPYQYIDSMACLQRPDHPIYIAGEALSWSNGWIQGAIFSGLMQAYLFETKVENPDTNVDPIIMMHAK